MARGIATGRVWSLGVVLLLAASGCTGSPGRLDQDAARRALLTEAELPGGGWQLIDATQTAPAQAPSRTALASGACGRALGVLDDLGHGSRAYAKGSYGKDGAPVLEVSVQGYESLPPDLAQLTEILRGCPAGTIDQDGTRVPFTLTPRTFPDSGASGARLTITGQDGSQAIDIAVAVRGDTVIVGTATSGGASPSDPEVTRLLDAVVTAQRRKLEETVAG